MNTGDFVEKLLQSIALSHRFDTYSSSLLCGGDNNFVYALAKLANLFNDSSALRVTMPVTVDSPADRDIRVFTPTRESNKYDESLDNLIAQSSSTRTNLPHALDDNTFYVLTSFAYFAGRASHYRDKLVELKTAYAERRRIEDEYERLLVQLEALQRQQFEISHS